MSNKESRPKQLALLKSILSEEEQQKFRIAIDSDTVLAELLIKIIEAKAQQIDKRYNILDSPAYPFQRAALDGQLKELGWIKQLLKGDSDK